MSDAPPPIDAPLVEDEPQGPPTSGGRRPRRWRPRTPVGWVLAGLAAVAVVVGLAIAVGRYGVLLPQARLLIEARAEGLKLGRFGRLKLEGLDGDIWNHFTIRRLTISDEKGVWLQADRLSVDWNYAQLLRRNLDIDAITAQQVQVLRRPLFERGGVSQGMPVSVQIDKADTRLEMLPAFSGQRGIYVVALKDLHMGRTGGTRLQLSANSELHKGDFLRANIDLGRRKELLATIDALEASGGAIAGAVGLAPDQPFLLRTRLSGTTSNGKLEMLSRSGAITPLQATGAWTPQGGAVTGRVMLSASRLTRFWETRLGPVAQITIKGAQRPDKNYDFDMVLTADNLKVTAKGPVNPGKRLALGLVSQAEVGDLTPLLSVPEMGAARVAGTVTGELNDLVMKDGRVTVWDIKDGDYTMPSVGGTGTARFHDRQLDFTAKVAGQGGAAPVGDWHRVILGPAPKATVSGSLLKDGRFLFRSIDASGKNMTAKGTGTRGARGGINLRGQLKLLSLAGTRPGSGGAAQMTWIATQKDDLAPWDIILEGSGQNFTLGWAELDRLIGKTPKFKLTGQYFKQVFTVSKVTGDGGALDIEGAGVRAPDGQLNFKGTFVAQGPFGVGPVEIAGKMPGSATLTGTFEEPKGVMVADFETLDLPQLQIRAGQIALTFVKGPGGDKATVVGGIGMTGATDYGPARAKASFAFAPEGVDLQNIDADMGGVKAEGRLTLRANAPSNADLTVDIGPGALLTQGRAGGTVKVQDLPGGPVATVRLETAGASVRNTTAVLEKAVFTADGPIARLPYQISAKGSYSRNPLELNGGGVIGYDNTRWNGSFAGGGQVRSSKFTTVEPITFRTGDGETAAKLRLSLGGGQANIDWSQIGDVVDGKAALQGVDIGFISQDFAGRFDADMVLQGKAERLTGSLEARLDNARSRDASDKLGMDGQVKAALTDGRLAVTAQVTSNQGLKSVIDVTLPTEASAMPFRIAIVRNQPISGRVEVDGEVQPLWDLFLGGERTVGGRLTTKATIGGTFNDPKISGQAALQDGRFEDYATGLRLKNMTVAASLQTDVITVGTFSASDPLKGSVSGSGKVSLVRGGGSDFTLGLKQFRLIDNDMATADASGEVTVTRAADGRIKIVGGLNIDNAEINAAAQLASDVPTMEVTEINRPVTMQAQLAPATRGGIGASLDVRLSAPSKIYVRGRGLDVEMGLDARVTGTTSLPTLNGQARIIRGDYEFAGKRFMFDETGAVQLSTNPELIRLDLSATREDPSLTAVIRIKGTAARPEITLTSTPVLPNDEVLSQVLFGRSASQLSPLEAAQLASALTALATGGGFDVIGGLRSFSRLDRLALAGGGQTAVSVAGGKYLTENVYLELAGGGRDGPSAEVDYRVNRRLSIISRLTSQSGAKLAVRWRRDLGTRQGGRR